MSEQVLLAVVFTFKIFQSYVLGTKVIVCTGNSALRYLMAKKDEKSRLIRWVLFLQEIDFEANDRKVLKIKLSITYHVWRKNLCSRKDMRIKLIMFFRITTFLADCQDLISWFADFVNYLESYLVPTDSSFNQRKKYMNYVKFFWDEPYLHYTSDIGIICR